MNSPPTTTADLLIRAARTTPGGVHSNVRLTAPRVFFDHGKGGRLQDVEGKDYVDYLLGQGPAFLGHGHPAVTAAVAAATARGMVFGAQHPLEVEASEALLSALGWADRVRFGVSGTEAVQGALRLVRAATGRRKVMRFVGHYHGWLDNVLMSFEGIPGPASAGQSAGDLAEWVLSPFNDADRARALAEQHDLAAIIVEPVMCNAGAIPAEPEFLLALREIADATGAVLIFDEVITGFRLALGGASEYFNITPDLAVYGKALAGGWPVSAIAGRSSLMDLLGTGEVNHSGTFNASMMASAAVVATLRVLREDPPYARINAHGSALQQGIRDAAAHHGLPINVQGFPVAFHVTFGPPVAYRGYADLASRDAGRYAAFAAVLAEGGVWVAPRGIWYVSAAHTDEDLATALQRIDHAMATFSS